MFEVSSSKFAKKHAPSTQNHNRQAAASLILFKDPQVPTSSSSVKRSAQRQDQLYQVQICRPAPPREVTKLQKRNDERAAIELLLKADIKQQRLGDELAAISKIKTNPKAFYSLCKEVKISCLPLLAPLLDSDDQLQSDPLVAQSESITDIDFDEHDVLDAIKAMGRYSAAGPDKFPALILKECGTVLAPVVTQLWRSSLNSGEK
ncbi:unnamed protein product [Arctogadus glacialis]